MTATQLETVAWSVSDHVATVTLSRPDVHNAFNNVMIEELHSVLELLAAHADARVLVLTGAGKSFCAGADLNWMRSIVEYSFEQNLAESLRLFDLMHRLYTHPLPTIARVNGATIGGGMGLLTACDIAVAADNARFSLSEVKVGIVPACISPFVILKAGAGRCREFFLTGERLTAARAFEAGLVNQVVPPDELDAAVGAYLDKLRTSGPAAMAICKGLIRDVPAMSMDQAREHTARCIAELRQSPEGQEGMAAFLEKRKPAWAESPEDSTS